MKNVQALYNYLVYPNNLSVFSQSPDPVYSLFSSTEVKGRIAPLGAAHDLETLKTYFFGFSPPSDQSTVPSVVTGVTFRAITEKSRSVAVEVDIEFGPTALGQLQGIQPYKLREVGFFTFDKQNRITSFDLTIPYLDAALPFYRTSDPNFAASAVQSICALHASVCLGGNNQYSSFNDCAAFLSSLPTGNWSAVNSNTLVCRVFHAPFVSLHPDEECLTLGPSGGLQCLDGPYSAYFDEMF